MLFNSEPAGAPSEEASAHKKGDAHNGRDELGNRRFRLDFGSVRIGEKNASHGPPQRFGFRTLFGLVTSWSRRFA